MVVVGIDEEKTNDASGELVNSILFNPIVVLTLITLFEALMNNTAVDIVVTTTNAEDEWVFPL